jgi:hypothetical protein
MKVVRHAFNNYNLFTASASVYCLLQLWSADIALAIFSVVVQLKQSNFI